MHDSTTRFLYLVQYTLYVHTFDSLIYSEIINKKNSNTFYTSTVNKNNHYFSYSVKCSIEDKKNSASSDESTRIRPKSILKLAK